MNALIIRESEGFPLGGYKRRRTARDDPIPRTGAAEVSMADARSDGEEIETPKILQD